MDGVYIYIIISLGFFQLGYEVEEFFCLSYYIFFVICSKNNFNIVLNLGLET